MHNPHLARAELLLQQRRYDHAEKELRQAIGMDPNAALAFAYLAICLSERKQWREASDAADRAVGLEPDNAFHHYARARVLMDRRMLGEARQAIEESLRLSPHDPDYWAMLANIEVDEKKWRAAVNAADNGLAIDAEHEACVNLRAIALTNLGDRAGATQSIDSTLSRNPLNATSHANMGWTLLHQGKPRDAMQHFGEALRLQPNMEWARAGLVEAMKARNIIYRAFLAYFLFMNRLSSQVQWLILIGGYIGYQVLRSVSKSSPALAPFITPLIVAYFVFAMGTIVAVPLFNLFLFLDRYGRHALDRSAKIASAIFGLFLLPPITFLVLWIVRGGGEYRVSALVTAAVCIPVALAGLARAGTPRVVMSLAAGVLAIGAFGVCALLFTLGMKFEGLAWMIVAASVLSTWLANLLSTIRPGPAR